MAVGKPRGGRPRKSPELRDVVVSCRVTQDEWRALNDRALNEGLSLNDLVRLAIARLVAGDAGDPPSPVDVASVRD